MRALRARFFGETVGLHESVRPTLAADLDMGESSGFRFGAGRETLSRPWLFHPSLAGTFLYALRQHPILRLSADGTLT